MRERERDEIPHLSSALETEQRKSFILTQEVGTCFMKQVATKFGNYRNYYLMLLQICSGKIFLIFFELPCSHL